MKTIILNQRKERDGLMSRPYLERNVIEQPSDQVDNRSPAGGQIHPGIVDAA